MTSTADIAQAATQASADVDAEAARSAEQVGRLITVLDELAPALEEEILGNEEAGRLSERTMELLRQSRVPSSLMPESLGGLGMFPADGLRVLERLCQIDASMGWVGANWTGCGLISAYFQTETAQKIFDGSQPYLGATSAPSGRAVPVDGGFRVSGAWSYGSGNLHAAYVICFAVIMGADGQPLSGPGGAPAMGHFIVPGSAVNSRGNWDTIGLRATGSIDFTVDDVFVPESFTLNMFAPPVNTERQVSGGTWVILSMLHTAFALGASRRVLDELTAFAHRPSSRGTTLAEDRVFRSELARQEIAVRSARAFVYEAWDDVDAQLKAGRPVTRRNTTLLRAAMINMHEAARGAAVFAFAKGGGTSLRAGTLQRWVRDTLAGCQHIIASDALYPDIAWELMGAPENMVWSMPGLISLG